MATRLVLAAVVALTVASAAAGRPAQVVFEDAVGDQRNTEELVAPDITSVTVSNTANGLISFRVTIVNHVVLPPRSRIAVLFDLDRSIATGFTGFEYAISHEIDDAGQARVSFERWNSDALEFEMLPTTNLTSEFTNGVYTLIVPRRELGNTTVFEFGLYAAALDLAQPSRSAVDDAPNTELWLYELTGLPAPRLATTGLTIVPKRPQAGRTFTVGALVRRTDTGTTVKAGSVTCVARIGKSRIRAVGRFSGGRARCVVSVPRHAKGKTLRVTVTIRAASAALSRTFRYRVV